MQLVILYDVVQRRTEAAHGCCISCSRIETLALYTVNANATPPIRQRRTMAMSLSGISVKCCSNTIHNQRRA